jgi:hypothetical protein
MRENAMGENAKKSRRLGMALGGVKADCCIIH